ncbi:hypothetical protein Scep_013038 [Stephania cephalantha]|uniref:Uncharacterized protein n=1 Tax=Stephania cephalantha TaxID=152367 RepID=A0AAP0PA74_9MAGN
MENSTNLSSMNKPDEITSTGATEESGWTVYFEDFFSDTNNREYSMSSTSSLVSDAASCAAWKFADISDPVTQLASAAGPEKRSKRLSFKKKRICRGGSNDDDDDDALEDTASSPANSPKISDLRKFEANQRRKDVNIDVSDQGTTFNQNQFSELHQQYHIDQMKERGFIGQESECTELKKRGLCLVPMSMLMNYLG